MLCGHRTLEFVLRYYWGRDAAAERVTTSAVQDLWNESEPCAGIVWTAQLADSINRAKYTFKASQIPLLAGGGAGNHNLPGGGNRSLRLKVDKPFAAPKRRLAVRAATLLSGWRTNRSDGCQTLALARHERKKNGGDPLSRDNINQIRQHFLTVRRCFPDGHRRISTAQLAKELSDGSDTLAVMLVDTRFLHYSSSKDKSLNTYQGHYITLFRYRPQHRLFDVFDSRFSTYQQLTRNQLQLTRRLSTMVCSAGTILLSTKPKNYYHLNQKRKRNCIIAADRCNKRSRYI
jgi:hypothetical protein